MKIKNFFFLYVITILHCDFTIGNPNPSKPKEKNFSFAIPAFLLGGGGLGIGGGSNVNNAVNNGNLPNINANSNTQSNQNANLNIGSNLFQRLTITRTILTTVATITAPVFRTCTTSMGILTPCIGRRKRTVSGQEGDSASSTFEMTIIVGSTTVTDQSLVSMMLNLDKNETRETMSSLMSANAIENDHTLNTLHLEPSDDSIVTKLEDVDPFHDLSILTPKQTPALLNEDGSTVIDVDDVEVHDHGQAHARINLGGTTTTTQYFPVTKVVNSTVSLVVGAITQQLTIMYTGCLPPTLPVTGTPC